MGCCSSIPQVEEDNRAINATATTRTNNDTTEIQPINIKKPEVTITRPSSSLHSIHIFGNNNHEKQSIEGNSINNTSSSLPSSSPPPPNAPIKKITTWPIYVRLSSNGQDITIQVPIEPPYLTVGGLRNELLPYLDNNTSSTRVKLIYLGRILPDQHIIVPTQPADIDTPLPAPKNKAIQIQKEGVIQAMVIRKTV